jgi:hypothetical protein
MHVALIQDDSIVAVGHYSKIFPNTSFGPSGPSAEFLEENSAKLVTNAFAYDPATHRLEDCPAYLVNDHVSTKRVVELTEWEVNQKSERKWGSVRAQRDQLLAQSDWTQVADAPGDKAAWATYRQALRDLPASGSDPDALTWPTSPDAPAPVVEEEVVEVSSESAASASATPIESSATPE